MFMLRGAKGSKRNVGVIFKMRGDAFVEAPRS